MHLQTETTHHKTRKKSTAKVRKDLYQEVTNSILKQLEKGVPPWIQPWNAGKVTLPENALTGKRYRGVNILLLWGSAAEKGFSSNRWMTFKQAQALGATVKKGEKSTLTVYFKMMTVEDQESGEEKLIPFLKANQLFNAEQCEGLDLDNREQPIFERSEIDAFVEKTGAVIRHGGPKAFYSVAGDAIQMPDREAFVSEDSYHATRFHELTHWTGASHRLNRIFGKRFGDKAYSMEELVAEMGSAFLCAELGVTGELRHASYLQSWIDVLRADKKAIFTASKAAIKAAEYLNGNGND